MRLPRSVRIFWAGSIAMFLLTLARGWVEKRAGVRWSDWDLLAEPRFGDLLEYVPTFQLVHTQAFWANPRTSPVAYPPFGAVLFRLLYVGGHPVRIYLMLAALSFVAAICAVARALHQAGAAWTGAIVLPLTVGLVSFPIQGMVERGNIELPLLILTAAGSWCFLHEKNGCAAMLWGLAATGKLYPIVLLALLLPRRAWRAFGFGVAAFVAASLASMIYLGPSLRAAWRGSLKNVFGYQGIRVSEWGFHPLVANHSFFGLVKLFAVLSGKNPASFVAVYYVCGALLFAWVFFSKVWKLPAANQLLMVSLFMVMLPPISYYYALVHLYAPLVVLIMVAMQAERTGIRVAGLGRTMLMFVPVLGSPSLLTFRAEFLFGGLIQAVLLCILFGWSIIYRFEVSNAA